MEESFLEKNLAGISRYNPQLAEKISGLTELKSNFEFSESKTGDIILSYDGIQLHNEVDPQDEALEIFKNVQTSSKSTIHVLFGLGLGYLLKRFTLSSKGKIIVFEPNIESLRLTMEIVDFSKELSEKDIFVINSKEELQKCFEVFYCDSSDVNLSFLRSYAKLYPELLKTIVDELGFIKGLYGCNYNNLFDHCARWTLGGIVNIPETLKHDELESLRDKFKDKPAVIISAGPSLNKNIDVLKEYQDKIIKFCVGSAFKTATNHGIKPDFLTVVESEDCAYQVSGMDLSDVNMILQPMTNASFQALKPKRFFNYYPNNDFTVKWLAKYLDIPLEDYQNRGTVSLCALFSAVIMGCNPIILIGQDLAYTNGKCYSDDSPFNAFRLVKNEETGKYEIQYDESADLIKIMNPNGRYTPETVKKALQGRLDSIMDSMYFVKGLEGNMIPTEAGYATFVRYFENVATEFKDRVKLVNSTEGGAYLEGFEHSPLKQNLEKYAIEHIEVESTVQESLKDSRNLLTEKGQLILDEVDKVIELLKESFEYFEKGKTHTERIVKQVELNRIYSDSLKKECAEVLNNFIAIEHKLLNNNFLTLGLIYPQYIKLSNHLKFSDVVDEESIKKFIELNKDFFIDRYKALLEHDFVIINRMRARLYESCNPTG